MARKSRKGGAQNVAATPVKRIWNVALYARLSVEDSGRKGADTIETQIELVDSYIKQHSYLSLYDTYIDNGESGKDFDRPAWNQLMEDIRLGKVDCVAVKDLSRFSRNYIETLEFLEKIFPFMGVRFISVNDGYDNHAPTSSSEGLMVALKALVNDKHLRDISRKICSTKKTQRERGEYTGSQAPFGYQKVKGNAGKLEPNPETAPIIRDIFEWRASGMGRLAICKRLDELGVPTPYEYLRRKRDVFNGSHFKSTVWREITLRDMLRNPVYIGTLAQGKHEQRLYEHKPCTAVPESEWIVTENAHQAIISKVIWDAVQTVETATRQNYATSAQRPDRPENVFKGYTVCGVCGTKMPRQYNSKVMVSGKVWESYYYSCPVHRQHPAEQAFRSIRADLVSDTVFPLVADKLRSARNLGVIIEKRAKRQENPRAMLDSQIAKVSRELETLNQRLSGLYESYVDKILTEGEYVKIKAEYEGRAENLRARIDDLSRRAAVVADVSASDNRWLKAARDFQNPTELTREMLEAIVERIVIHSPARIEVVWKFSDEFAFLETCAAEEGEVA